MLWFKKAAALLLVAAMCLGLLGGCGQKAEDELTLNAALVGEMPSCDPAMVDGTAEETLWLHLCENLMRKTAGVGGQVTVTEGVARSYEEEANQDGTVTYTFRLRDSARWSDGRRVRADDFVHAWQRLVDPAVGSPNHAMLEMVQGYYDVRETGDVTLLGVKAKSGTTLLVTLNEKCPYFLSDVCTAASTLPLRKDVTQAEGWAESWEDLVTNGPYAVARQGGGSLSAERYEEYHHKYGGPQHLNFRFTTDVEKAWDWYQSQEVDFVSRLPKSELELRSQEEGWTAALDAATTCILFNSALQPLEDMLVRQALNLAIDRDALSKTLGAAGTIAGALVPYGIPQDEESDFRTAGGDLLVLDPEEMATKQQEAVELLAQSGYAGGETFPELEYLFVVDGVSEKVAQAVQKMWFETLQIYVKIMPVTKDALQEALRTGNYTLAAVPVESHWADAAGFLNRWESDNTENVVAYANNAFDTLLAVIRGAKDETARQGCLHDAEQLLIEDMALAPLYVATGEWALQEGYTGVCRDLMGRFYFETVSPVSAGAQ